VFKKGKVIFLVVFVISVIIIGFISKSFADEKPKVVVVLKDLNSQYWEIVNAGIEKGFKDFGINGKVIAPREEQSKSRSVFWKISLRKSQMYWSSLRLFHLRLFLY
jgi:ribose transport system substrate-binding protein